MLVMLGIILQSNKMPSKPAGPRTWSISKTHKKKKKMMFYVMLSLLTYGDQIQPSGY